MTFHTDKILTFTLGTEVYKQARNSVEFCSKNARAYITLFQGVFCAHIINHDTEVMTVEEVAEGESSDTEGESVSREPYYLRKHNVNKSYVEPGRKKRCSQFVAFINIF